MLQIHPLSQNDLHAVSQIEIASRRSPWRYQQFETELTNSNSRPLVLLNTETQVVIGYIIPWFIAGEIQIQNIVVKKSHRQKGLGRWLLNTAISMGLEAGCDRAILEVRESNSAAIKLYERYQFTTVGRRENYYRDGENALLMTAGPFTSSTERAIYREFVNKEAKELQDQLQ